MTRKAEKEKLGKEKGKETGMRNKMGKRREGWEKRVRKD